MLRSRAHRRRKALPRQRPSGPTHEAEDNVPGPRAGQARATRLDLLTRITDAESRRLPADNTLRALGTSGIRMRVCQAWAMSEELVDAIDSRASRSGPGARRPTELYDSVRDIYYVKPLLRGWLHLVWFVAALVLGSLLIIAAHGAREVTATAVYVPGVAGLFGVSALYHRGNWSRVWSALLQRADHAMIFVAISATATPAYLLACPGTFGKIGLTVMWAITAVAVGLHMVWMDAPEMLVGAAFVAVGAASGLAIPDVWIHAGIAPALLLIAGGVLHGIGAISYQRRSPDPVPTVFGYHEVFHAYSCAATACQYAAIAMFLI